MYIFMYIYIYIYIKMQPPNFVRLRSWFVKNQMKILITKSSPAVHTLENLLSQPGQTPGEETKVNSYTG